MTTNARDEKWSEWYPNNGVDNPIPNGAFYEVKDERGEVTPKNLLINVRWRLEGDGHDIIAYRYKIKEPESGIAEADEEECLQLAYERMNEESVPTSVKQLRYQDAKGEDWIDEFARTASVDEFRGAMKFTIGKYNRRAGKKDELIKEIEKMRDYCDRWIDYERSL